MSTEMPGVSELQSAMSEFDRESRREPAWKGWEDKKSVLFVIRSGGRIYPLEHVLARSMRLEAGAGPAGFQACGIVEAAGFEVEALHMPANGKVASSLHDLMLERSPASVVPREAVSTLAQRFRLTDDLLQQTGRPGEGRVWDGLVDWGRALLERSDRLRTDPHGRWVLPVRGRPVVWLEKTQVTGRPDRLAGTHALGQALWSPIRGKRDRDTYSVMRDVQPGDYVLHLIDGEAIVGASRAQARASLDFEGIADTAWAGSKAYSIPLADHRKLAVPLHRDAFLRTAEFEADLRSIRERHSNLFFSKNLTLLEGFYLTPVPFELVVLLDKATRRFSNEGLPLIEADTIMDLPSAVSQQEAEDMASDDELVLSPAPTERRVWLYAPGRGAERWDEFYEKGLVAIGWDELGDLTGMATATILERLKEHYGDANPTNKARACHEFANAMQPGDLVFAKRGRREIVGFGTVTGEYRHDPERSSYTNIRKTRWDGRGVWASDRELAMKALTDITDNRDLVTFLKRLVALPAAAEDPEVEEVAEAAPGREREPFTIVEALEDLFVPEEEFRTMLRIWRGRRNLIIQGPPGVGKTFLAKRLAYALMGYRDPSRLAMVQFHQSYSYEDFVQGFRPAAGGLVLKDGLFVSFCDRAARDKGNDYVFVIDEINRGNLSKILGELLMLIEADKRDSSWAIPLAYAADGERRFYVPDNVHILGLMNTADRSLAFVDHALRRRFSFWMAKPQVHSEAFAAMLSRNGIPDDLAVGLVDLLGQLNHAIGKDVTNLGAGYAIGHSYFCRPRDEEESPRRWLADIAETELIPLFEEYWIDDPDAAALWASKFRLLVE
ncbi:AAA family ATPase [Sphingomonas sp. NFR15]|uniref:AAA family ATPase n=1 Tax=Sphingomonas sp. NFR15 TaxID=1566282 RepID=UPI00087E2B34|nr:AAA family ATPase [Sphingomonas sp. NFR15]SDA25456.1 AAA domain (dynein-related subfamily) [Sphingomonas sp. NFR15]